MGGMYPLDPKPDDMRAMGEAAVEFLIGFIHGLDEAPLSNVQGSIELARSLRASPPEEGGSFADVFEDFKAAAAAAYETCAPGYLPYIPGGGLYAASLAQFLAMGVNRFPNLWEVAPGMQQIEENVVRWLCDLFAFPPESRGILTTGGSIATLSAVVTARHTKLGVDFGDGTYYVSDQAHASVSKAATIAGFSERNLRLVPTDAELRMDPDALRAMIRADRDAGFRPFLVVPAAGTTNTGAIDPLNDVAEIAETEELWMHVDAAYGGFFQLTDRGRERIRGDRAGRLHHARPAQGDVPAVRHGLAHRAGRNEVARLDVRGGGVPTGSRARGRTPQRERVLARALPGPPRLPRVAPVEAARRGRVPRSAR